MITAANLFGLYSAFLACKAICLKSNLQHKLAVETIFCNFGSKFEFFIILAVSLKLLEEDEFLLLNIKLLLLISLLEFWGLYKYNLV